MAAVTRIRGERFSTFINRCIYVE